MTPLNELRQNCRKLIAADNLGQCLTVLGDAIKPNVQPCYDDLVMTISKHTRLVRKVANGLIDTDEAEKGFQSVANSILFLLKQISDDDITEIGFLREQIHHSILVLCRSEKLNVMKQFFGKEYFPNLTFKVYGEAIPEKKFDVIVLEDDPIGSVEKAGVDIWAPLKNIDAYFFYYGEGRLNIPVGFENKVYFANSRFSIYARLKELLDYMKYYGK